MTTVQTRLDPESLGIITLNSFLEEFFPNESTEDVTNTFQVFHYNGLARSHPDMKVSGNFHWNFPCRNIVTAHCNYTIVGEIFARQGNDS